jgi:hypothetical protein
MYPICGNHVILEQFTLPRAIQIVHIGERDQYHCIPITTPEHFIIQDSEGCTWISSVIRTSILEIEPIPRTE